MNLAESMKYVLKTKSQGIFTNFWKQDLKNMLKEIGEDVWFLVSSGPNKFQEIRKQGLKNSFIEIRESSIEAIKILKIVPRRVREGFTYFKDDFLHELDSLPDSRQKALFCMKVMGSLSGFILRQFYGIKKSQVEFKITGLKHRNAFTKFLIAEIVFKISQILVTRVLCEVEKELTDPEDVKNIRYFKGVLNGSEMYEEHKYMFPQELIPGDKAHELVENLRKYISSGVRR